MNRIKANTSFRANPSRKTSGTKTPSESVSFWQREIELKPAFGAREKRQFFQVLSTLLASGLTLTESIEVVEEQTRKKKIRDVIKAIRKSLSEGSPLSSAMENYPKYFDNFEVYSVKMGEQSGRMSEVLNQLGDFHEKRHKLQRKIMQALSYPFVVIFIAGGVMAFMIGFVVPMFEGMFDRFDAELPGITQAVLSASDFFRDWGGYLFLLLLAGIFGYLQIRKTERWKQIYTTLVAKIPILGNVIRKIQLARFCYAFALMLKSKVKLEQTLDLLEEVTDFYPVKKTIAGLRKKVVEGGNLYDGIKEHKVFPPVMKQMIRVGEKTARLDEMLGNLARNLEEEGESGVTTLTNLLEPLLIVILALLVGIILVSMYLPMFELSNVITG